MYPKVSKQLTKFFLLFLLLKLTSGNLFAQNPTPPFPIDETWLAIEDQLEQQESDTALYFIILMVREECGQNFECLNEKYLAIMWHFERKSNFFSAIYINNELAKECRRRAKKYEEGQMYYHAFRYYGALNNQKLAAFHLEKALKLNEEIGNQKEVRKMQRLRLEKKFNTQDKKEVLKEMEILHREYISHGESGPAISLLIRMIHHAKSAREYDKMLEYLNSVEKALFVDSLKVTGYEYAQFYKGKAEYVRMNKDYDSALFYYQKSLEANEKLKSEWYKVMVLVSIANMEFERGRLGEAKKYLSKAFSSAETFESHELLEQIYRVESKIAEQEGRYSAALEALKKERFYEKEFDQLGAGFSTENYFLTQEKEKLAAEKENSELQLQLKNSQLRNSIIIIALALVFAVALALAFFNQRKSKNKLAARNELIKKQAAKLRSLDAAKTRFFANVSHELRTPISLIQGPIGTVLKRNQLNYEDRQLLKMARQGGQNLQMLVNEILDLGKMESGKMELTKEPVRAAAFFTQYFAQFESLGYQNGVTYGFESLVSKNLVVLLDREKCRQIVYNLLSNAFKFTTQGDSVKVDLKIEENKLYLSVSNTGKGIHPNDLPHVFDRYFQTSRPDASAAGGTGIGLALCKEYVHLFGGNISVESQVGKGTQFKIEFPVEMVENAALVEDLSNELALEYKHVKEKPDQFVQSTTATSPVISDTEKPTILVVEDNLELQAYIQIVLQEHYKVLLAENGQAALDKLAAANQIDLIISDLMMPVMDGYQLLEKLKDDKATQQLPVIMLTARAEKDDRLKALRIGVDDYLTKPFDEEELLARINNLLANQSMRKEAAVEEEKRIGTVPQGLPEEDREWLHSFETYLQQHLSNNHLSVLMLADEFAMSMSTLLRQLKRLTGLTPQKYLMEVRLEKARQLLAKGRYGSVSIVAREVGYNDVRNFSKSFKNRFGKSPSDLISA